jgi:urease accessory protein UreE
MTVGWQETANEVIKSLFLKDDKALEGDRLSIEEEDAVEVSEIREYIYILKPNKVRDQSRNISKDL